MSKHSSGSGLIALVAFGIMVLAMLSFLGIIGYMLSNSHDLFQTWSALTYSIIGLPIIAFIFASVWAAFGGIGASAIGPAIMGLSFAIPMFEVASKFGSIFQGPMFKGFIGFNFSILNQIPVFFPFRPS
jgi:hypothetical protein